MKCPVVLSIAGSDCSGGAGIQADIKTISAIGCYAASVVTAVTVQNTCGVVASHPVKAQVVAEQIEAVTNDLEVDAIKIGMVADAGVIQAIANYLSTARPVTVFDPVLVSSSGYPLVKPRAAWLIATELMPNCTLVTPNLPEAEILSGQSIRTLADMEQAARRILDIGCQAVLVKGGHLEGHDMVDILATGSGNENIHRFASPKIDTRNTHGTGCTLSSAIASYLALGCTLTEAVGKGKEYLTRAISAACGLELGKGHGPLNHFFAPEKLKVR